MPPHTSERRLRDLLPMPLPSLGLFFRWRESKAVHTNTGAAKQLHKRAHRELWTYIIASTLNFQNCGRTEPRLWTHPQEPSLAQRRSLEHIRASADFFCSESSGSLDIPDWETEVNERTIDYNGDETTHALPIVLEELKPGLPCLGLAGSAAACDLASLRSGIGCGTQTATYCQ